MLYLPYKRTFTIGIFGSNGKTSTANMLSSIFNRSGLCTDTISSKNNVVYNKNMENIESYKKLKYLGINDIIIVEVTQKYLRCELLYDIEFDVLIYCSISEDSYESSSEGISKINKIINNNKNNKVVILNTDDTKWNDIAVNLKNTYLITYGLGNKATVTASSIECGIDIRFCYCLQRSITNLLNNTIEPVEIPVLIKAIGQYNVYNGLATITAALLCGINIDNICMSLLDQTIQNIGLNEVYSNGFKIIENKCDTILGYETGFEAIQNISYQNVVLIFGLNRSNSNYLNRKIMDIVSTWSRVLRISRIYFYKNNHSISYQKQYLEILEKSLYGSDIIIDYAEDSLFNIEGIINSLKENDLLLFFCSNEMKIIRKKIIEMLDRKILQSLQ